MSMNDTEDFNPLDVLATAASLQNDDDTLVQLKLSTTQYNNDNNNGLAIKVHKTMPEGLKPNTTMVIQNSTQLVLPSSNGKTMTVLQIDKQVADHSYAFVCQLDRVRDDDAAFMSRSGIEADCDPLYSPGSSDTTKSDLLNQVC